MKRMCLLFVLFSPGLLPGHLNAQKVGENSDSGFGIFDNKEQYVQFMGSAKKMAYGPNGSKELQAMIPMLNDIALNKPIGSTAGNIKIQASTLGMLSSGSIRSEIEMVEEQYRELKKANERIRQRVAEEIRGLDFSKTESVTTRIRGIRDRAQQELESLLLPHQVKRLRQLHLQSRLQRQSLVDVLTDNPVGSELRISKSQEAELRKEEAEIEGELQKEIQRLRIEARKRLLDKLKPEQKQKAEELFGDSFEFDEIGKQKPAKKKVQIKK